MGRSSFYVATGRDRTGQAGELVAKDSYTYNYKQFLPQSKDMRVVDLGCSEGISLEWLAELGYSNVVGVDDDCIAIKYARDRLAGRVETARILNGDVLEFARECPNDSVDMYIMFNVIEHIKKDILLILIPELYRSLKPGGVFLAQTGNLENPFNLGLFSRDFTHEVLFTKSSLLQLMIMSGFDGSKVIVQGVKYKTTIKNVPLQITAPIIGLLVKGLALCMRINIRETSPLIFCHATK